MTKPPLAKLIKTPDSANNLILLYQIAQLFMRSDNTVSDTFSRLISLIPRAWPKPKQVCIELVYSQSFISIPAFDRSLYYQKSFVIPSNSRSCVLNIYDLTVSAEQTLSAAIEDKLDFISLLIADIAQYLNQKQNIESLIEEQRKRVKQLDSAYGIAHLGRWEYDIQDNKIYWSDEIYRLCGYEPQSFEITFDFFERIIHPDDRQRVYQALEGAIENHESYNVEYRIIRKDGQIRYYHCYGETEYDTQGQAVIMRGTGLDITENKQQQKRLELMAHYDLLTKLPNRTLLADRFSQAIARLKRNGSLLAICFLDLDNFKPVNDTYGHEVGDQLLIEVAQRIKANIREEDTVSRFGGDEFVILLGDLKNQSQSEQMMDRIHQSLAKPYLLNENTMTISASSGLTLYPIDTADDLDTLMRHADQAMYQSKVSGRNRFHVFNADKDQQLQIKHLRLQEIQVALLREDFCLYYQPKVNMKTGEVFGAEALIRWIHPEKGLIPPLEFLPVIDGTDLEIQIGDWVIQAALTQLKALQDSGIDLEISVNISSHHLQSAPFFTQLDKMLAKYPSVNPKNLQLEILESSVLSNLKSISSVISDCQNKLGVQFALDDFGTGYSSLTHLRSLPAEMIKIDQSFVRDMLDDPNDYAIIDGVMGLANAFSREVIAEGVETIEHGSMLLLMGCELAQGYGIARPMPAVELAPWLQNYAADSVWLGFSHKKYTQKENKIELFKLAINQWQKHFRANIQATNDSVKQWPIIEEEECHCGKWLMRTRKEQLFDDACIDHIEQAHKHVHLVARALMTKYQSGKIVLARKELNDLDIAFEKMHHILAQCGKEG